MYLLKIGIFNIDYTLIILFLIGLVIGAIFFGLIFLILKLSNKNKSYMIKSKANVSNDMGMRLVEEALIEFQKRMDEGSSSSLNECKDISLKLINDIAKLFFPKSKMPLYELSIDEIINLAKVVGENIDYRLKDSRLTRYLKGKITISFLFELSNPKEEIEDSPIEEYKFNLWSSIGNAIKSGVKKITNSTINYAVKKFKLTQWLSRLIICTIGEETFKVFYIKIYNETSNIDTGLDDALDEILNEE